MTALSTVASRALDRAGLGDLRDKVVAGERLDLDDGVRLFETTAIAAVGALANLVRERKHGDPMGRSGDRRGRPHRFRHRG